LRARVCDGAINVPANGFNHTPLSETVLPASLSEHRCHSGGQKHVLVLILVLDTAGRAHPIVPTS
jgi:hypothetical protein